MITVDDDDDDDDDDDGDDDYTKWMSDNWMLSFFRFSIAIGFSLSLFGTILLPNTPRRKG